MNKIVFLVAFLGATMLSTGAQAGDRLAAETNLNPGEMLISENGKYALVMQADDGNLVVYANPGNNPRGIWNAGRGGRYARMQMDGNFVVYKGDNTWKWQSGTGGRPYDMGYYLKLGDNGSLQVFNAGGESIWSSPSDPQACPGGTSTSKYLACLYYNSPSTGAQRFTTYLDACNVTEATEKAQRAGAALGQGGGGYLGNCR